MAKSSRSHSVFLIIISILLILCFLIFCATATAAASDLHLRRAAIIRARRRPRTTRACDANYPQAICLHLQRMRRRRPPQPLPPSMYEVDPRYGVQKRLVPSGPNPLHN
uniref:CLAVATA3/ESR (CLE)-related protein 9 n=1 Tax=Kalanchoe fedtschenkoi TaxID=63787 RepID=A0A7N0VJI6_KALFE